MKYTESILEESGITQGLIEKEELLIGLLGAKSWGTTHIWYGFPHAKPVDIDEIIAVFEQIDPDVIFQPTWGDLLAQLEEQGGEMPSTGKKDDGKS